MNKSVKRKHVRLLLAVLACVMMFSAQAFAATVKLNKKSVKLNSGKKVTLKLEGAKDAEDVSWATSDADVATVKDGRVTALKAGTTKIFAIYKDKSYTCKVTVKNPAKLSKKKLTLNVGENVRLKVNNVSGKVKWSSQNKKVAKVSSKGNVRATGTGSTKIKAVIYGKTLTCKVTVNGGSSVPANSDNNSGSSTPIAPDTSNKYSNANNYSKYLYDGKITIAPKNLYYSGSTLIAECFVVNGMNSSISNVDVTNFQLSNSSGTFAQGRFGVVNNGRAIKAHSYITWTFRFPNAKKADLTKALNWSNYCSYGN